MAGRSRAEADALVALYGVAFRRRHRGETYLNFGTMRFASENYFSLYHWYFHASLLNSGDRLNDNRSNDV
jgi:hypothetical protein